MKVKRRRGRQKKRLEDSTCIKVDRTGLFASSARPTEKRTRWKGFVAKSFVVLQRPWKVMG